MFIPPKIWREKQREKEVQIPLTLELPLPTEPASDSRPKEKSERGVWTVDI